MKETLQETILQFFFPKACGVCEKIGDRYLCKKCELQLAPKCHIRTFPPNAPFQKHIYIFSYQNQIRNLLLSYKFKQQSYLFLTFSEILIKNEKIYRNLKIYDIILAVPISKQRKKERGYNQSALLARQIAKKMHIPYTDKVLTKIKHTMPQSALGKEERAKNVKNAYKIANAETLYNKKVLLIDDIYTTGNTVKECSNMLKQAGAKIVGVLTIAKD